MSFWKVDPSANSIGVSPQDYNQTRPDNLRMTKADMLMRWQELYEQIFPVLLEYNISLPTSVAKSPEELANLTAEHVNEAIKQFQLMEEKVEGLETLAEVDL